MRALFELFLSMVIWAAQIGLVLLIAFVLASTAKAVEEKLRLRSVKRWPRVLAVFLLLCAVLAALAVNPPVVCEEDFEAELTEELEDRIRAGADGLYSWRVPLVPVYVEVTGVRDCVIAGNTEHIAEFSIYYFCFGKLQMEYYTHDGYNAYPMFGL